LIESHLPEGEVSPAQFIDSARAAIRKLSGSYAVAIVSRLLPDQVLVARKDSPLVIGLGDGENFLASDIPAVMAFTRRVVILEDGDCALVTGETVEVFGLDGVARERGVLEVTWDDQAAEKGGFDHF